MTENSDEVEEHPSRRRLPSTDREYQIVSDASDDARVLAPLLKSLGWELVGVGAEFEIDGIELRKSTGKRRHLVGKQSPVQRFAEVKPAASISCS